MRSALINLLIFGLATKGGKNDIPISTNCCEAYNRHFITKVSKSADALELFYDLIKKEEDIVKKKIGNIMNGIDVSTKK